MLFLLATYGIWGKFWFRVEENENKIIADLHVLELFMAKKHDLSEKIIFSVMRRCRWTQNMCHAYSLDNKT
jgi:hypothetical protein